MCLWFQCLHALTTRRAERITNIRFFQQFDGYVGGQTAWSILQTKRRLTFSYQEWQSRDQRIEVSLSSVLFQHLQCV